MLEPDNNFCLRVRSKGVTNVTGPEFSLHFGMHDAARRVMPPLMTNDCCESRELCKGNLSPALPDVSEWAIHPDDVGVCLRLVMQSKHIVTGDLLLHLGRSRAFYYKSKDLRVHFRGVIALDSLQRPIERLTPVPEALFANVNRLGLFEILRDHGYGAAKSWFSIRRSRTIA